MAKSKCGPCGHGLFELETIEAGETKARVTVLHCARCGAVAGPLPQLQDAKIDEIAHQVHRIDAGLRAIVDALNKR
jgi:hypothetical protein